MIRPAVGEAGTRIFHLDDDPLEQSHFTLEGGDADRTSRFLELREALRTQAAALRENLYQPPDANPDAGPLPPDAEAALRALGYLGGRDRN